MQAHSGQHSSSLAMSLGNLVPRKRSCWVKLTIRPSKGLRSSGWRRFEVWRLWVKLEALTLTLRMKGNKWQRTGWHLWSKGSSLQTASKGMALPSHLGHDQNSARHRDACGGRWLSEVSRWELGPLRTSVLAWWYLGLSIQPHCTPASGPETFEIMDAWLSAAKFEVISYRAWENEHRNVHPLSKILCDY